MSQQEDMASRDLSPAISGVRSGAPWWVATTYLIYAIVLDGGILGTCFYLVYLGHSGWWVVGGLFLASCTLSPKKWHRLWAPKDTSHAHVEGPGRAT